MKPEGHRVCYLNPTDEKWYALTPFTSSMAKAGRTGPYDGPIEGYPIIKPPPEHSVFLHTMFYVGRQGQWRNEAIRKWRWDRQGIHMALGAVVGATLSIPPLLKAFGLDLSEGELALLTLVIMGMQFLNYKQFVDYEVNESADIRDISYPDLGGSWGGWLITTGLSLGVWVAGFTGKLGFLA